MNARKQRALLDALTPEIRAYLFPGWSPISMPCRQISFDLADEAEIRAVPAQEVKISVASRSRMAAKTSSAPKEEPEELDPKTAALLKEIERIQKEYGVSIEEIELLLGYQVTLSPMHITRSGKLFLVDFNEVEVKLDNVSKALYFLYLKHPEGIPFKDVADHREELLSIYRSICGRDNPDEIEKSIDHLVNPLGNALNVAASRIKIAFRNVVSDRVAKFYYINGSAREAKKVPLDRDLVIWL